MENQILIPDSLNTIHQIIEVIPQSKDSSLFYYLHSIGTFIIACVNVVLLFYIFRKNRRINDIQHEKNRKITLLKTLILDYNMKYLYDFFEEVIKETEGLKANDLHLEQKQVINGHIVDLGKTLRQRFTDTMLAIDKRLYDNFLENTDLLIDHLTKNIFDEGVNLSHLPKFEEVITNNISISKTKAIKILFEYSGE